MICVKGICHDMCYGNQFASVSTIFRFDFGIIPTVWYFLVSILSHAVRIHI
jgi:hypothetical protein